MTDITRAHRPFLDVLHEMSGGKVANELSEELYKLVSAIGHTGKKGTLTLSLAIEPDKEEEGRLLITPTVNAKPPVRDRRKAVFFVGDDGNLTRTDPNQHAFEGIKAVEGGYTPGETREGSATNRKAN